MHFRGEKPMLLQRKINPIKIPRIRELLGSFQLHMPRKIKQRRKRWTSISENI
ncbi:hypothetical protein C1H46_031584 [Malus baccata]|uniref:Uncharacterized protein n=1 Tax=Malus baccata TaxID=106549 RepID=A0A540L8M0_MALBA|nr:hypothetical protein C1H46_031584 [Malus baccata]